MIIDRLDAASSATVFNPYAGVDELSAMRRHNLSLYLRRMAERQPRLLLLGEAPGYRGCRVTGVPFTSESILLDEACSLGLFGAGAGFRGGGGRLQREASATAVWSALADLNRLPLLWNAFPYHPHRPDEPDSNRPPTAAELAMGREFVVLLLDLFAIERVIAVGNKAAVALEQWGVAAAKVRHPSHGGQTIFRRELTVLLAE